MSLGADPRDGRDLLGLEVHGPDGVVLGVGHVKDFVDQAHSLGPVEPGLVKAAVGQSLLPRADHHGRLSLEVGLDDPVVAGVRDEQAIAGAVGDDLAGIEQGAGRSALRLGREGRRVELELSLEVRGQLADRLVEEIVMSFAADRPDIGARRVDQHQRRPAIHAETLPYGHVSVVDDRMLDPVFRHLAPDVLGVLLGIELGRVDADHHQLFLIFLLELRQVGQNVVAVDAAIRPEIQEDDLALELGEVDGAGVDPADSSFQTGLGVLTKRDQRDLHPSGKGGCTRASGDSRRDDRRNDQNGQTEYQRARGQGQQARERETVANHPIILDP